MSALSGSTYLIQIYMGVKPSRLYRIACKLVVRVRYYFSLPGVNEEFESGIIKICRDA